MGGPDRGNLFSAWFLSGFGGAVELGASPVVLGICPSVGRPVLLLGMGFPAVFSVKRRCPSHSLFQCRGGCHYQGLSTSATPSGSPGRITLDKNYSPL